MDEIDVTLCRLLIYNSRMSYSELARAAGISVQTAHRRIQELVSLGVIARFNASFSARAYRSTWVLVHGPSQAPSMERVLEDLNGEKEMDMVMVSSGKYLYISGTVLDPGRINRFTTAVTKIAKLVRPEVGVVYNPSLMDIEEDATIYPLDLKIVSALKYDSRRPVTEVARELGLAPRTVNRHISRLMKSMLVHFAYEWYPQRSGDIISAIHLNIREGQDPKKVAVALVRRLSTREIITYNFSDRPETIISMVWSPSIHELNNLVLELERDGIFKEVVPRVVLDARYYEGIKSSIPSNVQYGPR
ncbi:MAG: HTH-type transcriptional regulator Ptr1 [Methanomassiliicoccales archaeon PtaB.Bin134]|nr:MAG: HTH-type transcriptional regulator Ptr1 [Methanomassiliicoccales archaeon PtaB.Bin134]